MGTYVTGIPLITRNIQPPPTPVTMITVNKTVTGGATTDLVISDSTASGVPSFDTDTVLYAQGFVLANDSIITQVKLLIGYTNPSLHPVLDVRLSIYSSSGGYPNEKIEDSTNLISSTDWVINAENIFLFNNVSLPAGAYCIVVSYENVVTHDASNFIDIQFNSTDPYVDGKMFSKTGSASWSEVLYSDMCATIVTQSVTLETFLIRIERNGVILYDGLPLTELTPIVLNFVPYGTYNVYELGQVGYNLTSITPSTFTISASNPQQVVEVINAVNAPALELTWDDIANVPVADAGSVSDWNTFFDLPTNGTPFTSVEIVGNVVKLYGGSGITLKDNIFSANYNLISIIDNAMCIIHANDYCFNNCYLVTDIILPALLDAGYTCFGGMDLITNLILTKIESVGDYCFNSMLSIASLTFPLLTSIGNGVFAGCSSATSISLDLVEHCGNSCFEDCSSLTTIYIPKLLTTGLACFRGCSSMSNYSFPLLTALGDICFGYAIASPASIYIPSCTHLGTTVLFNNVFYFITGKTVSLTIPTALMTCNSSSPDGDIAYLIANNTVTIYDPLGNQIYP